MESNVLRVNCSINKNERSPRRTRERKYLRSHIHIQTILLHTVTYLNFTFSAKFNSLHKELFCENNEIPTFRTESNIFGILLNT